VNPQPHLSEATPLTWTTLRDAMGRDAGRSDAWLETGLWALESLASQLGADWPTAVARKSPDGLARELALAPFHISAYTSMLETALRIELLSRTAGFAKVRRVIRNDPRPDQLAHARLQLEIAGLALRRGLPPRLEPKLAAARPTDVVFESAGHQIAVEARVLSTSGAWRRANRSTDQLFDRIHALEITYGIRCEGEISDQLTERESDRLMGAIEDRAQLLAIGATPPSLNIAGTAIEVVSDTREPKGGLRGPRMEGDSWARLGPRIAEKAEVAKESGANWLRIDALDGLWQFTSWAQGSLTEKLEAMAAIVRTCIAPLDGVVLSSGALLAQGLFHDEDTSPLAGAVALRRLVGPLRVRETLIIPATPQASEAATVWKRLYEQEPTWLQWALARCGRPSEEEIFAY
jgi:hypothetical protein